MTRILLLLALTLTLAACGGARSPRERPTVAVPAGAVTAPNFGDVDPHAWDGRDPSSYAVHGTDTSRFQTAIDWRAARSNGVNFAFIKATEGGDHVDERFRANWDGAKAAGVPRGAYHFVFWCRSAREQMDWFKKNVPNDPSALPPVLDVEWNGHSQTCPRKLPKPQALAMVTEMLSEMERYTGKRPIIYTSVDFHRDNLVGQFKNYHFWVRSVAAHPAKIYEDRQWAFWQYTATGVVPGVNGPTDINVFAGSEKNWRKWIASAK